GFWVNYTEVTPAIPGLEVSAEIAGDDWYSTNWYTSNGLGSFSTFIHHHFSDDEYKIMLGFDDEDMSAGTYQFTPLTDLKFARLAKYDIQTKQYVVYNCTGTIEITSNENAGMFSIVSGNYSFTAVHPSNPSETIQVSNGSFKTNYSW